MVYPGVLYPEDRVGLGMYLDGRTCHVGSYCLRGRLNYGEAYGPPMLMNSVREVHLAGSTDPYGTTMRLLAGVIMGAEVAGSPVLEKGVHAVGVAADKVNPGRSRVTASEGSHLTGKPLAQDLAAYLRAGMPADAPSPPITLCT